jgi:hypothetical protein
VHRRTGENPYDYIHIRRGFDRWVYKEKLDASFTEIQDLTRFKSEVRELHRIITLNRTYRKWRERLKRILMDTTNIEGTVCAYFLQEYSEFWRLFTRVLRTGLLKPRRMCRRDYDRGGELRRISTHVFNEIIKERLDWIWSSLRSR